jgi:ribosomal protein S18 acetylase RimI-like enzyme
MAVAVRSAAESEWAQADRIAVEAFAEYEAGYPEWLARIRSANLMTALARDAELIVAADGGAIVGAVGYVPPSAAKDDCFAPEWAVLRMLSVAPAARGRGVGRMLVDECVARARRDAAPILALYTSPVMTVALPMYERMGFDFIRELPARHRVPCVLYTLSLASG